MIALWIYLGGLVIGLGIALVADIQAKGEVDGWVKLGILTTVFIAVTWPISIPYLAIKGLKERA